MYCQKIDKSVWSEREEEKKYWVQVSAKEDKWHKTVVLPACQNKKNRIEIFTISRSCTHKHMHTSPGLSTLRHTNLYLFKTKCYVHTQKCTTFTMSA